MDYWQCAYRYGFQAVWESSVQWSYQLHIWWFYGSIGKTIHVSLTVDFVRAPAGTPYSKVIKRKSMLFTHSRSRVHACLVHMLWLLEFHLNLICLQLMCDLKHLWSSLMLNSSTWHETRTLILLSRHNIYFGFFFRQAHMNRALRVTNICTSMQRKIQWKYGF